MWIWIIQGSKEGEGVVIIGGRGGGEGATWKFSLLKFNDLTEVS